MVSNLCLFVGLSGSDPDIEVIANRAYQIVKEKGRNLVGYMFVKNEPDMLAQEYELADIGVIQLYYNDYDELPEKIREICRKAAKLGS